MFLKKKLLSKLPAHLCFGKYNLKLYLVSSPQSEPHPCLLHLIDPKPKKYQSLNKITKENWQLTFDLHVLNDEILLSHKGSGFERKFDKNEKRIILGK